MNASTAVCVPECPAEAIFADTEKEVTPALLEANAKYSEIWPNITQKREPFPDADDQNGVAGKMDFFSTEPGPGD